MPRNKALLKKRAAGAPKKIVIKPFSKPPALPANFYETTSRSLLAGTMSAIFDQPSATPLSYQDCYTQVVHLVSHQFGPRLYADLIRTFRQACREHVLPDGRTTSSSDLLAYVQEQYQQYVEYLLLCKDIFLPLDRSHAWCPDADGSGNGTVINSKHATKGPSGSEFTCRLEDLPVRQPSPTSATASFLSTTNANSKNSHSNTSALMGLWQAGLEQFRRRLDEFNLHELVYQRWWESLKLDWDGNLSLDQQRLLQTTLYMWQDLGILSDTLSRKLEPDLVPFFTARSQDLKNDKDRYSAKNVILYCHGKWVHVAYRWSRFLPKSTCVTLLEIHLFQPHLQSEWLLDHKHFDPLIEAQAQLDSQQQSSQMQPSLTTLPKSPMSAARSPSTPIQKLWMLSGRLPGGLKLVAKAISQYARSRGLSYTSTISDSKMGKQRIGELIVLQGQMNTLLSHLPQAADHCSLKSVWEDVVNPLPPDSSRMSAMSSASTNLVAESLAKYVDQFLRDKKQTLDSQWATRIISGVFSHLQAKDVFEAFYKHDLAKRLLWNKIVSNDIERFFVSLLKAECGAGYTSKMEGMFQDINWSSETMTRYKQATLGSSPLGSNQVDMDIQVLTTGYWPVYPQYPNLILPESLKAPQERFSSYYSTKYQGRRMTWQYALGHLSVRFMPNGKGRQYDLIVGLCQALVLIQFNQKEGDDGDGVVECTLPQLMNQTGIDDRDEMERVLQSLSVGRDGTRVLHKRDFDASADGTGKRKKVRMNVDDRDVFVAQSGFQSKTRRIRITNIAMKESKEERDKTVEAVSRDRLYLIDAVLVRIMKARKTITHQQLIAQVLEQVKVPAQLADVKKRIESLIEREYLERDKEDRNRYNYMA